MEIRGALGPVLDGLELQMAWAFKYSNHQDDWPAEDGGVSVHADEAAVNVNQPAAASPSSPSE